MFNKMHKFVFVIVSTVMLLVLGLGLAACQAPTEIQAPPSQPEQPAAQPSQPEQPAAQPSQPEQPAAQPSQPEQPAVKQLSFEAKTYTNSQYGFSITYPKDWVERRDIPKGSMIVAFGIPDFIPGVTISVRDADSPLTADWIKAANTAEGNTQVTVTSDVKPTTLDDGTPAFQYTGNFTSGDYEFASFATSVDKNGKRIRATVWTIDAVSPYNEALFSEIAHTLSVK